MVIVPPYVVKSGSIESIENQFYYLLIPTAVFCVMSLLLALICK